VNVTNSGLEYSGGRYTTTIKLKAKTKNPDMNISGSHYVCFYDENGKLIDVFVASFACNKQCDYKWESKAYSYIDERLCDHMKVKTNAFYYNY